MDFKLGKRYSLKSKKTIDAIFASGERVKSYPFTAIIKVTSFDEDVPFKIVFSAPKRTFRLATKRNRIKRVMREAVRLQKSKLDDYLSEHKMQLAIFLVYSTNEELDHEILLKKTDKLIDKIIKNLDE